MERTAKRKVQQAILGVAISMLVVGMIWRAWPRKRLLLEHTVKIATMEGGDGGNRDYVWASDHEVMLYSETVLEDRVLNRMLLHDTNTSIDHPLKGLSERLCEQQAKHNHYWLSTDGNWMLYCDFYNGTVKATPRDGSRCLTWYNDGSRGLTWHGKIGGSSYDEPNPPGEYDGFLNIRWLPDSHHWIQPLFENAGDFATHIVVHSIDSPQSVRILAIPKASRFLFQDRYEVYPYYESKAWLSDSHLLVQTSDLVPGGDSTAHSVNFYEVDLASEAAPRTWTVSLPQEWIIKQVVFSPHADHVAWVFHQQYLSPLLIQLKRLGLPVKTKPIEETMVYVSRNDGTEMRQIGIAPSPEHASDVYVTWLPDGTHLSFVYNEVLFTIPTF